MNTLLFSFSCILNYILIFEVEVILIKFILLFLSIILSLFYILKNKIIKYEPILLNINLSSLFLLQLLFPTLSLNYQFIVIIGLNTFFKIKYKLFFSSYISLALSFFIGIYEVVNQSLPIASIASLAIIYLSELHDKKSLERNHYFLAVIYFLLFQFAISQYFYGPTETFNLHPLNLAFTFTIGIFLHVSTFFRIRNDLLKFSQFFTKFLLGITILSFFFPSLYSNDFLLLLTNNLFFIAGFILSIYYLIMIIHKKYREYVFLFFLFMALFSRDLNYRTILITLIFAIIFLQGKRHVSSITR